MGKRQQLGTILWALTCGVVACGKANNAAVTNDIRGSGGSAGSTDGSAGSTGGSAGSTGGSTGSTGGSAGSSGVAGASQCVPGTGGPGGFGGDAGCESAPIDTDTDPTNCGQLGHVCDPVALASDQGLPGAVATDATHVYWLNSGSNTFTGCTFSPTLPDVCSGNTVGTHDGAVMKVPLGGGTPIALAGGMGSLRAIAADATNVYFVEYNQWFTSPGVTDEAWNVMKVPLGGGTPTILAERQAAPTAIVIRGANAYWVNYAGSSGELMTVPTDGGTPRVLAEKQHELQTIAADSTNIYWADTPYGGGGGLMTMPLAGGTPTLLTAARGILSIVADGTNVYWIDYPTSNDSVVKVAPRCGGTPTTLATGMNLDSLALNDIGVFWFQGPEWDPYSVMKKPFGCGAPTKVASGTLPSSEARSVGLAARGSNVYWTNYGPRSTFTKSTPVGSIAHANGVVMRLGSCTNGRCE